jgi:hypothetical protein
VGGGPAAAGAVLVVMDGLDRDAVLAAVQQAAPEVIVNQMTSLGTTKDFRHFDQEFAQPAHALLSWATSPIRA